MSIWTQRRQDELETILGLAPVIAVVTLERVEVAAPLARALVAGGIRAIEVTLRTRAALEAIEAIAADGAAVVGAGTVRNADDLRAAEAAGARFAVAPGASLGLLQAAENSALPFLPGSATASEAMTFHERGFRLQKFFPAEAAGGVAYLRALAAPLPDIRFCPTGGIDAGKAAAYLALPNVIAVGGSWLAPPDRLAAGDFAAIEALARQAAALRG